MANYNDKPVWKQSLLLASCAAQGEGSAMLSRTDEAWCWSKQLPHQDQGPSHLKSLADRSVLPFLLRSCNELACNPTKLCKKTPSLLTLCKRLNSSSFLEPFVYRTVNDKKKRHLEMCLTLVHWAFCTSQTPQSQVK